MLLPLQGQKRQLHASEAEEPFKGLSKPLAIVPSGFNPAAQDAVEKLVKAIAALLASTVYAKSNHQVRSVADILNDMYRGATRPSTLKLLSKSMFLIHACPAYM